MTKAQELKIAQRISMLNSIYGIAQTSETVAYFASLLADLEFEPVLRALDQYALENKTNRPPTPAHIREMVLPKISVDARANEAGSRIRQAIAKFGWPNGVEARAYIGELGWRVVERSGGWQYLCENHGVELSPLTFHAQARDLAKATIEMGELGQDDLPIGIPAPKDSGLVRASFTNLLGPAPLTQMKPNSKCAT